MPSRRRRRPCCRRAAHLFSQGKYVEALASFDRAAQGDDAEVAAAARRWRIRTALRTAEFANARRDAEPMVAEAPRDAEALALHGDALWASGLFEEAESSYRAALDAGGAAAERRPARPGARPGVAWRSWTTRWGRSSSALEADPDDPELLAVAGINLRADGALRRGRRGLRRLRQPAGAGRERGDRHGARPGPVPARFRRAPAVGRERRRRQAARSCRSSW